MFGRSRVVVVCGLVTACGGGAQEAQAPQAPAAPVESVAAPSAELNPVPAELAQYWVPLSPAPEYSARVALGKLARGPLFQAILPTVEPNVPAGFKPCFAALVKHSEELLVRGEQGKGYAIISFDEQGLNAVRESCLGSVVPTRQPTTIRGASEAYAREDQVLAFVPPAVLLAGQRAEVEKALSPDHATGPLPAHFTLKGDELMGLRVDAREPAIGANASLASSPQQLTLDARALLPVQELAERIEQGFVLFRGQAKERVKEAGGDASVVALLDGVTLERTGKELHGNLAIKGTIEQQAHAIGQLTAMSIIATERYLLSAKTAEAKATLAQIVKAYQQSFRDAGSGKKPRKLVSLPPVPAVIPRGDAYQSTPDDWKPWASIGFSLAGAQRFQYEVVAAKDGKSAQVIARADLDGDGEASERKLTIELDAKTLQLTAKGFDETLPLE